MAQLIRSFASGVTISDALIGSIVYESDQGEVSIATSSSVEPLGVVVNIQPDGKAVIAGAGERGVVKLSEDFEYSDSKIFTATTAGAAAVFSPAAGTVTTATVAWSVGYVVLPYETKGASGSMQECFVLPQVQVVKAS